MDTKEVLSLTEINAKISENVCFFLLGKLDRNNLYPRPKMLDQATMKLSVQIPKSENPDNREPREIADITNCYTDHDIAQVVEAYGAMEEEPKPVTYWGSGTEHDPLCYKTRHCHIKSIKKYTGPNLF